MTAEVKKIIGQIKKHSNEKNRQGMARFGIEVKYALGASMPVLRKLAKELGKNHKLAGGLWATKIHEARILACLIDDSKLIREAQMEKWVSVFNSWDLCDQCCMNLFDKTSLAEKKAIEWAKRNEEFVRRAGFALMATLAVHDKKMADKDFLKFFPLIQKTASDERNFVRKAVNWALRQIGKRNKNLNKEALILAKNILKQDSKSAKWIARDAIRELESPAVQKKISKK